MAELTEQERQTIHARIFGADGQSFDRQQLEIYAAKLQADQHDEDLGKAIELMMAGWTMNESPYPKGAIMGFFWRRPVRKGTRDRKGRLYRSTDQAYNALKNERRA